MDIISLLNSIEQNALALISSLAALSYLTMSIVQVIKIRLGLRKRFIEQEFIKYFEDHLQHLINLTTGGNKNAFYNQSTSELFLRIKAILPVLVDDISKYEGLIKSMATYSESSNAESVEHSIELLKSINNNSVNENQRFAKRKMIELCQAKLAGYQINMEHQWQLKLQPIVFGVSFGLIFFYIAAASISNNSIEALNVIYSCLISVGAALLAPMARDLVVLINKARSH